MKKICKVKEIGLPARPVRPCRSRPNVPFGTGGAAGESVFYLLFIKSKNKLGLNRYGRAASKPR